ncbi:hypothetical protein N1F78_00530 [Seonamhaeicola sp. MEBiC1930]|uniref:hypothetical protein n=1 Tax=Seonamhaeicola sp. MEBiC01930 TaxID=2976768 RepID=UPI0032565494
MNFTDKYNWFCKVLKVKSGESFLLKIITSDYDWNPTTFGFDIETKENGTYLKFSHENWPENNDHFKHSSLLLAMLLNGLKNYLVKGVIIPFDERN